MEATQIWDWQTFSTTDVRFRLGQILEMLQRRKRPVLIISRSKPKAWLYPYEVAPGGEKFFSQWQKEVLPKYAKTKAKELIALIRQDRDRR
jgi:PHD/YefM family antitoxin component YafN of YafNO toxin-antitoxin module